MRFIRPAGIFAALVLIVCCYFPWFVLESKGISVSGVNAEVIRWGKPAYGHFFFCGLFLLFHLCHRLALRIMAIIVAVLNIAWAVRDIYIGLGNNGEAIVMQPALYVLIFCAFVMLVAVLSAPEKTATR